MKRLVSSLAAAMFFATLFVSGPFHAADVRAEGGTLTGKFVLEGMAPKTELIDNPKVGQDFPGIMIHKEEVVIGPSGGIKNVVIWVRSKEIKEKTDPAVIKALPKELKYDNKNGRFDPRILPVVFDKQKLIIANSDKVGHNANLQPPGDVPTNPLIAAGGKADYNFGKKQSIPVPIGCNIHPWMKGYILPLDHPYAAVTDENGEFKIENLPAGEWEFQVWHEGNGFLAAKKEWEKGRFKLKIAKGENKLGEIKVPLKLLEPKPPAK